MIDGNSHWLWGWVATLGLAVVTVITRAFFLIPKRELPLPEWFKRGLRYAPLAALTAVVAPEIVMHNGQLIGTWLDARLPADANGAALAAIAPSKPVDCASLP